MQGSLYADTESRDVGHIQAFALKPTLQELEESPHHYSHAMSQV